MAEFVDDSLDHVARQRDSSRRRSFLTPLHCRTVFVPVFCRWHPAAFFVQLPKTELDVQRNHDCRHLALGWRRLSILQVLPTPLQYQRRWCLPFWTVLFLLLLLITYEALCLGVRLQCADGGRSHQCRCATAGHNCVCWSRHSVYA